MNTITQASGDVNGHAEATDRLPPNGMSVLIVGAGIGGLMAALQCWRVGCDVRIFERQPEPVLTGDSFTIGPSAFHAFSDFPQLMKDFEAIGYDPRIVFRNIAGEKIMGPVEFRSFIRRSADLPEAAKLRRHSRPQLYRIMLEQLDRLSVQVEYGKDAVDYFEDQETRRAGVVLGDGSRHDADLVVAADGLWTHSWKIVAGHKVAARPSGRAIYRAAYPIDIALADPVISERFPLYEDGKPMMEAWNGGDLQIFIFRNKDEMQWSISHPDDGRAQEKWDHHPSVDEALALIQHLDGVPEAVHRLMKATPSDMLINWRLMWRDPQPKWTSPGGLVLQLGDAAHTFLPSSGNGGTQAVEDAASLAACIALAGKDNIEWATRVHNLLRFERVSCLMAFGVLNDAKRKKTASMKGKEAEKSLPELGRWILTSNPEQYANEKYDEALSHLQTNMPFANTNTPPGLVYQPWTIEDLISKRERGEATVLDGDWS